MTSFDCYIVWTLAAIAAVGVMLRPWRLPEAIWPVAAAVLVVIAGALSPLEAWHGVLDGIDVYLFLAGMMLLGELAREEGVFDWLAAQAAHLACGSAARLFLFVYLAGVIVTVFLSNDATAVVLTPAVIAMTRAARVEQPMPYLFACALVANAASFVLPISNPANLVVYGRHIPVLGTWLARFTLPSVLAILATLLLLYWTQRRQLQAPLARPLPALRLTHGGRVSVVGIGFTAVALMAASAASLPLGLSTLATALITVGLAGACTRELRWRIAANLSWGVFPLVAGLFVLVRALDQTHVIDVARAALHGTNALSVRQTSIAWAVLVGLACNLANNLPVGLLAGRVLQSANPGGSLPAFTLVAVDLSPNLSVSGSLATLLWIAALRRERVAVSAADFLRLGVLVAPPTLALVLAAMSWQD